MSPSEPAEGRLFAAWRQGRKAALEAWGLAPSLKTSLVGAAPQWQRCPGAPGFQHFQPLVLLKTLWGEKNPGSHFRKGKQTIPQGWEGEPGFSQVCTWGCDGKGIVPHAGLFLSGSNCYPLSIIIWEFYVNRGAQRGLPSLRGWAGTQESGGRVLREGEGGFTRWAAHQKQGALRTPNSAEQVRSDRVPTAAAADPL